MTEYYTLRSLRNFSPNRSNFRARHKPLEIAKGLVKVSSSYLNVIFY